MRPHFLLCAAPALQGPHNRSPPPTICMMDIKCGQEADGKPLEVLLCGVKPCCHVTDSPTRTWSCVELGSIEKRVVWRKGAPHLILQQAIQFLPEQIIVPAAAAVTVDLFSLYSFIESFRLHGRDLA